MRLLGLLIMMFCLSNSSAQNASLDKAKQLVDSKKYESALNFLYDIDPDNQDPEIVIIKTHIFLNYFVTSIMHQIFAVKDLEENEQLSEIRGSEGSFAIFSFPADSILIKLIEKNPNNYKLQKTLGKFYHEIHLKYPDSWLISDSEIINKFAENYVIAYENGVYDYWSL